MGAVRRERSVAAPPAEVWEVIADPHHIPRWWPGVTRVEAVSEDRFTQVLLTRNGRAVRMDFSVVASEPPRRRRWEQEVLGTPFERVLRSAATEIVLAPAGAGTLITVEQQEQLRGSYATGGYLARRAARRRLEAALDGLERILAS
jgi:uncharacterized protein YndB with AHSA1/START domain